MANRWFVANRGLVVGLLTASNASGQLIFLPLLASLRIASWLAERAVGGSGGPGTADPAGAADAGGKPRAAWGWGPYGADAEPPTVPSAVNPFRVAIGGLARGAKFGGFLAAVRELLGLRIFHQWVGRDASDPVLRGPRHPRGPGSQACSPMMGVFDLIGTTFSGWLTDRYNARILLFWYYGLRGLSLVVLPFTNFDLLSLSIFAVFYGLDWVATVPPTVGLTTEVFGKKDAPVIVSWIVCGHQMGGALAALGGGADAECDRQLPDGVHRQRRGVPDRLAAGAAHRAAAGRWRSRSEACASPSDTGPLPPTPSRKGRGRCISYSSMSAVPPPRQRMMLLDQPLQPLCQYMRIYLRRRDIGMSQQQLQAPQIRPMRQQMGGE